MHVKKGDIGLTVSQGTHTIIASVSETIAEADAKIDGLIKDLDAIEMPVPMGVRKNLMSVVAIANRAENPEEFFQSIFG